MTEAEAQDGTQEQLGGPGRPGRCAQEQAECALGVHLLVQFSFHAVPGPCLGRARLSQLGGQERKRAQVQV